MVRNRLWFFVGVHRFTGSGFTVQHGGNALPHFFCYGILSEEAFRAHSLNRETDGHFYPAWAYSEAPLGKHIVAAAYGYRHYRASGLNCNQYSSHLKGSQAAVKAAGTLWEDDYRGTLFYSLSSFVQTAKGGFSTGPVNRYITCVTHGKAKKGYLEELFLDYETELYRQDLIHYQYIKLACMVTREYYRLSHGYIIPAFNIYLDA
jgi:hypothetical protein